MASGPIAWHTWQKGDILIDVPCLHFDYKAASGTTSAVGWGGPSARTQRTIM